MAGRRPARIDDGEYATCLHYMETLSSCELPTVTKDTFLGWWGKRTDHPHDVRPDPGKRLIISEPKGARDDIQLATQAWRVLGDRGFEVAAETGHRITDVARSLGYTGVIGVAVGSRKVATLVVALHAAPTPTPGGIDALLPHLIGQTNKQFEGDGIPLQLPLAGMMRSQARA